jgi:hypothetical protein
MSDTPEIRPLPVDDASAADHAVGEVMPPRPPGQPDADTVRAIEAIVLVAVEPVPVDLIAQLLELPANVVESLCAELAASYDEAGHGFQFVKVAGGYRYQTSPDLAPYVERFLLDGQRARMSGAALETLAIVAYKQPISRAQVASIRGVDPDGVAGGEVVVDRPRVQVEVGAHVELQRVDEDRDHHDVGVLARFVDQREVSCVQRSQGRYEGNAMPGRPLRVGVGARRCGRVQQFHHAAQWNEWPSSGQLPSRTSATYARVASTTCDRRST